MPRRSTGAGLFLASAVIWLGLAGWAWSSGDHRLMAAGATAVGVLFLAVAVNARRKHRRTDP